MSFDEHLDKRLRQLKKAYEEQPRVTDVNDLVSKIQQIKKHKTFHPFFLSTVAVTVAVCMFILVIPFFNQSQQNAEMENVSFESNIESEQAMKKDFLEIEGIKEETTFYFVKNEELNISTYYPEDMLVQNEKDKIIFYANFGNHEERDAFIEIYKLNGDVFSQQKEIVENVYHDYAITENRKEDFVFAFSEQEFILQKGDFFGIASVFHRGNQFFGMLIHFPLEYEEGFLPRAEKIILEMK